MIQVLENGRTTPLYAPSAIGTIVQTTSHWDNAFRCEKLSGPGAVYRRPERTAQGLLLRLQIKGDTRLTASTGKRRFEEHFRSGSLAFFADGFHLKDLTWETTKGEVVFASIGDLSPVDESLHAGLRKVDSRFAFFDGVLSGLVSLIGGECSTGHPLDQLFRESVGLAICARLASYDSRPSDGRSNSVQDMRVRRAADFIHSHLGSDMTLLQLADVAGMSRFHFVRAFKRSMGLTPFQYVAKSRITAAQEMLAKDHKSIAEVALSAGYASQSHFTAAFTRTTGIAPSRYRNQARRT